ncbi:MAG: hypothetical protein L6290_02365 [Thermodesulfovibrionales bacterium]|nr:hypothetical protein [Thermodesulfovibrionales bacterium]
MSRPFVTIPVPNTQVCKNCNFTLGIHDLVRNVTDQGKDPYGMPAVMVRCPVCKTIIEWEPRCN